MVQFCESSSDYGVIAFWSVPDIMMLAPYLNQPVLHRLFGAQALSGNRLEFTNGPHVNDAGVRGQRCPLKRTR